MQGGKSEVDLSKSEEDGLPLPNKSKRTFPHKICKIVFIGGCMHSNKFRNLRKDCSKSIGFVGKEIEKEELATSEGGALSAKSICAWIRRWCRNAFASVFGDSWN